MPADDFLDAGVVADDELGSANPHGPASLNHRMLATGLIRLLGIKSLGDALTDPTDPPDPNGFYKLIQQLGADVGSLEGMFGPVATADTLLNLMASMAVLLATANTNSANGVAQLVAANANLAAIDATWQAIAALLATANTNSAAIAAQLVAVNANLVDLVTETAANT